MGCTPTRGRRLPTRPLHCHCPARAGWHHARLFVAGGKRLRQVIAASVRRRRGKRGLAAAGGVGCALLAFIRLNAFCMLGFHVVSNILDAPSLEARMPTPCSIALRRLNSATTDTAYWHRRRFVRSSLGLIDVALARHGEEQHALQSGFMLRRGRNSLPRTIVREDGEHHGPNRDGAHACMHHVCMSGIYNDRTRLDGTTLGGTVS